MYVIIAQDKHTAPNGMIFPFVISLDWYLTDTLSDTHTIYGTYLLESDAREKIKTMPRVKSYAMAWKK